MPSSKATRRRPTSSEPRVTRPRRRASDFHTRSLCRMDIVPSIRNAACPQTRPNAMFSIARTYRAESGRSKIPADKATAPAMIGHLARSKPSRWGILRATDGLRSCPERHIGDRCIPPHHPLSLPAAQPHHDRRREAAVEDAPREGPHRITTPRGSGCSSSAENAPAAPASAHVIPGGAYFSERVSSWWPSCASRFRSCHRVGRFGAQPWLLASSLADTPFSCSRQTETDEQPTAVSSSSTTATTALRKAIKFPRFTATHSRVPQTRIIVTSDPTLLTRTLAFFPPAVVYGRPITS